MGKPKRLIIYGFYMLLCLITEAYFFYLFPDTGLGGLICWPLTIIFSLGLGYVIYKRLKSILNIWQAVFIFVIIFIFQITLQLLTMPQEIGGDTFSKIGDTYRAFKNYKNIKYTDFPNLTNAERIAYIYKFKNVLPTSFTMLQIDSTGQNNESIFSRFYKIENRNGYRYYDISKLAIKENDSETIITEHLQMNITKVYNMNRNFLNNKRGGWGNNGLKLWVEKDDLKMDTGLEKLLFRILGITKKPNR